MNAIYTDLHIHTSENADKLNSNYDVDTLIKHIKAYSGVECTDILISLTDHNVVNKNAYTKLINSSDINVLLGVELHVRNYPKCKPYHCHIYFDISRDCILENIDSINGILKTLYKNKCMVTVDDCIPSLEEISKSFDKYDYLMLPHGGQSHCTFDKSFPRDKDISFDTALERNIYYNQFDGFTSRSNEGVEETESYFKKLGISSFINLITCTDNYDPNKYPASKNGNTEDFLPTWINSKPTFQGLRLALSEKTRLYYQKMQPKFIADYIKHVELKKELIDINIDLTPGLNVIIGGSSSGKTLLMDSIYNSINNSFTQDNTYQKFHVDSIKVDNPAGNTPHYINQNYIIKLIDEKSEEGIENIDIIRNTFLSKDNLDKKANAELKKLESTINDLFNAVSNIELIQKNIRNIKHFPRFLSKSDLKTNYFDIWVPNQNVQNITSIDEVEMQSWDEQFEQILKVAETNPFIDYYKIDQSIKSIRNELLLAKKKGKISADVIETIRIYKDQFDKQENREKTDAASKKIEFEQLLALISDYKRNYNLFKKSLQKIKQFSFRYISDPIKSNGHTLSIESNFVLNETIILDAINTVLSSNNKIIHLSEMTPESLFTDKIDGRKKKNIAHSIYNKIQKENKRKYVITTKDNKNFDSLSPGWKTAVLLDLILGYSKDNAPVFIDQPEDNLATSYINGDLVNAIKKCKEKKQLLIISHNTTIPMLADAQNIILCKNINGKILIRSGAMEDSIDGKKNIDSIAEITDGGKASVKKRVKKYNLKSFREGESNEN